MNDSERNMSFFDDDTLTRCEFCGCTELHACELDSGPCWWFHVGAVSVCTNPKCIEQWNRRRLVTRSFVVHAVLAAAIALGAGALAIYFGGRAAGLF